MDSPQPTEAAAPSNGESRRFRPPGRIQFRTGSRRSREAIGERFHGCCKACRGIGHHAPTLRPTAAGPTSRACAPSRRNHRLHDAPPRPDTDPRGLRRFADVSVSPQPPIDLQAAPVRSDVRGALRRVGTVVGLGVLPIVAIVTMFVVGWRDGPLSGDFHHELYPEAKLLLRGENPFPSHDTAIGGANFLWPPAAAYLVAPVTVLPPGVADILMVAIGLTCFALSLWLVGVRDWRVYGVVALWPEFAGEMRVSHLTPVIAVLLAAAWRWRDSRGLPGLLVGAAVAVKFFVWPVGVWLAATRRIRDAALAAIVAGASLLLILPFTSLRDYAHALSRLGKVFDQDSYNVYGLLIQAGASDTAARAATVVVAVALLAGVWRYQSFALAVAAALVLSPISWLDYYALAALPLALVRPRLSLVWFLPLATWGPEGAGIGIGDAPSTARLLLVFAVLFWIAVRGERLASERAR